MANSNTDNNINLSLRAMIDQLPSSVFLKDAKTGQYIYGNALFLKGLKKTLEEIVGKTVYDFFSRKIADSLTSQDAAVFSSGKPMEVFHEFVVGPNGEKGTFKITKSLIMSSDGRDCLLGIMDNVSVLTETIKNLRQKSTELGAYQKLYKSLSFHAVYKPDAKGIGDVESVIWSGDVSAFFDVHDRTAPIDGSKWMDLIYQPDFQKVIEDETKEFELCSGKEFLCEFRINTAKGPIRWYSCISRFYRRDDSSPVEQFGILADINNLKEMELRHEVIEAISDSTTGLYYVNLDTDTFRIFKKPPFLSDSDMNADFSYSQVMNFCIDTIVCPEDRPRMRHAVTSENIREELKKSSHFSIIYLSTKEAGSRYFEMMISRPTDAEEINNVVISFYDCHEQMMIQREKERLSEQLEKAYEKAKIANEAKTRFLFNMSHDIRTPMNAIIGYSSMAKKYSHDTARVEDYLNKVEISGKQLLSLINQVLEMSRIESGKIEIVEAPMDIHEAVRSLKTISEPDVNAKGVSISFDDSGVKNNYVLADATRLSQVLLNVIGNAIKYTPEGGSIDITFTEKEGSDDNESIYECKIADTGIGMSEEFLKHIYEEFSRENTSTVSHVRGTGLGMTIVRRLVDLMHGTINISSKKGEGTTVVISVPLKHTEKTDIHKDSDISAANVSINGVRVLLVEDNEMNREIAKVILEDNGVIVEEATDGDIAVEMVKQSTPGYYDMVLMDIQMPRLDGYEATRQIRALENKQLSDIPIIAMTANAFAEDKKAAMDAGMNEHLAKPVNSQALRNVVSKYKK